MNLDRRLTRRSFVGSHSTARGGRRDLFLTIGIGIIGGLVIVLQARYLSRVVSQVFLGGAGLEDILSFLLILLVLALTRAMLTWLGALFANQLAGRVKSDLRESLATHLTQLGPNFTSGERSGELSNTVTEGIEALDAYLSQYLPQLAFAVLIPLTMLVFVFPLDPLSGLVLLVTAPLIPFFMNLIGNLADSLAQRQWDSLGRMSAHFLDVLQGLTTLKLFGRSREQIEIIAKVSDDFRQTTMGVLRVAFLSALVLEMLATISTAVVAVQIGLRLLYGYLDFEAAFFVLLLAPEFYLPLRMLGTRFHAGTSGIAAARRIFEILETPTPFGSESLVQDGGRRAGVIRFSNVSYAYDGGGRTALQSLDLEIRPGEMVVLVGPSGAGKSTVAHLLLRFIEPDQGEITVDDAPLCHISPPDWRRRVAWVPQKPYLFNASVSENLRLAWPEAGREDLVDAARLAYAHDFIRALPQNYETLIGEGGARLSGGQAQRLALARTFLALQSCSRRGDDTPLLILDEPTANLDPEIERDIQDSIARLVHGRTALVIAHRLSTVVRADRILVMEAGQLVESGAHETLMGRDGLYRKLVTVHNTEAKVS